MKQNNKPSWREIIAFAVGDGGCNLVWTTIGSYLTLYYTDSVGIAAATIGTLMLLSRLLDGVSDLVMGSIIDRTHTRWGKARPWILWSAIPMGLGLVLMFSIPSSLSSGGKLAYASITYILMAAVIYTACNLAYNTLLALEAPNPADRVTMSSIRFFLTMATVLFINYNLFLASTRIVCKPSASCDASPASLPCTLFQYWLDATGIPLIVKYLLSSSNVADKPPRLATTTLAPTFIVLSKPVL